MTARKLTAQDTTAAVDQWIDRADHPHLDAIRALRRLVREADPAVEEGIKWNVPSFRTHEYFATVHVRMKSGVGLVLHRGAKKRSGRAPKVADPDEQLEWLAPDRAMVAFADAKDVRRRREVVLAVLREWLRTV